MATHSSVLAWRIPGTGGGGAWWAAVYGVTQSRTRLKQLSSIKLYIIFMLCNDYASNKQFMKITWYYFLRNQDEMLQLFFP